MDKNKILNSDYLDILFDGKNKTYGGYELRKKYTQRALLSAGIVIALLLLAFGASAIKPKEEVVMEPPPIIEDVELKPPPPIEEDAPPPPEVSAPPPPTKATFVFDVPKIEKNENVREEEKVEDPNKEDNKDKAQSNVALEGSDDPRALDPGLNPGPSGEGTQIVQGGNDDGNTIHTKVEKKASPTFNINDFVKKNTIYPEMAKANEIEGRVMVTFVVEKDGSVSNVKVEGKDPGGGLGAEAIRVVKKFPRWNAALVGGKEVRSYFRYPINFTLTR